MYLNSRGDSVTDHLEPYRRMARSIRFFPPSALALKPIPQPVATVPVVDSWVIATSSNADVKSIEPAIDLSAHAAALVHEAVCKPTVLPATYVIPENIGDRISRLVASSSVMLPKVQPSTSQSAVNGTTANHNESFDRLVYDPQRQIYALESTITEVVETPETIVEESMAVVVETPETIVEEPIAVVVETPETIVEESMAVVVETPEAIVEEPIAVVVEIPETIVEESMAVVVETPETIVEEPIAVVSATELENSVAEVAEEDEQPPTFLEKVSSVIDAVSTAFMNPELVNKENEVVVETASSTEAIATSVEDTESLLTTAASEAEAEPLPAPTLMDRVSAVVEVVTTTLKNPEAIASTSTTPKNASQSKLITVACPACSSTELRKNGRRQGKQRYACKDCGRQFAMADTLKTEEPQEEKTPTVAEEKPAISESTVEAATSNNPQTAAETADSSDAATSGKASSKKKKAKGFGASKKNK